MKDDPKGRIVGIRDLTDPFFLAKREAILRECREVLGDDFDDSTCPHCGRTKPCVTGPNDSESEEELYEYSDDDSAFSFEEEYQRCINGLATRGI